MTLEQFTTRRPPPDTAARFQANRALFIRRSLRIGAAGALAFAVAFVLILLKAGDAIVAVPASLFALCIVGWTWQIHRIYRCPHCRAIPMIRRSGQNNVDFNPTTCRKCNAALR